MAAVAQPSVRPQMYVILFMARQAILLELLFVWRAAMAGLTSELAVRSAQRKSGLLTVIELPELPAVRRMAPRAVLAEVALVDVIFLMAVDALVPDVPVGTREMALLARHRHVQADQRELGQVVI